MCSFADREINRASNTRNERDRCGFVAFANDLQCAVPATERKIFNVCAARFAVMVVVVAMVVFVVCWVRCSGRDHTLRGVVAFAETCPLGAPAPVRGWEWLD